jgi:ferredoxin
VKLVIDPERCQGHTLCKMAAPALIELDDEDGHAAPSPHDLADQEVAAARAAVATCPESALKLV